MSVDLTRENGKDGHDSEHRASERGAAERPLQSEPPLESQAKPEDRVVPASSRPARYTGAGRRYRTRREQLGDERIADGLGWLSLGLGLTALLAPRQVCRAAGLSDKTTLVRAVGVREIAAGAALLTQQRRTPWLWARTAGDVMDLALVGSAALRKDNPHRGRAITAFAILASIGATDLAASLRQSRRVNSGELSLVSGGHEGAVDHSLIVNKSPEECYAFWRDLRNLSQFIPAIKSVDIKDERLSHWVMKAPTGTKLEWESEITADHPGKRLSWRSLDGSAVKHAGSVRFERAPGGRGTIVRLSLHYEPVLGRAAVGVATLMGHGPVAEAQENLRRFKHLIETGEIPTTCGQPSGRRSWLGRLTPEGRKSRAGHLLRARQP